MPLHVKKGMMQPSAIRARLRSPVALTNFEKALWMEPELNLHGQQYEGM